MAHHPNTRPYVRLLRLADELRSHRFFIRGASGAVRTYLALKARPKTEEELDAEVDTSKMTPAEKKRWKKELRAKALKRQKAAEAKAAEEAAKAKAEAERKEAERKKQLAASGGEEKKKKGSGNKSRAKKPEVVDEDPKGEKLAASKTPLEEAAKFVAAMELFGSKEVREIY